MRTTDGRKRKSLFGALALALFLLVPRPTHANHTPGHYEYAIHNDGTKDFTIKSGVVNTGEDLYLFEWLMYSADELIVPPHSFIDITRNESSGPVTITLSEEHKPAYLSQTGETFAEASRKMYYELQRRSRRMANELHQ